MIGTMTPLERLLAVVQGKTPDYVPVFPMLNEYAAHLLKVSELEYYRHPERMAEGQMALVKHFDYDFLLAFTYLAREAAAMGGKIQYHEDASPTVGGLLARSPEELLRLEIPDFESNPETKVVLDQIGKMVELSAGKYPIVGVTTGPFSWPTLIMGNDQWLTSLFMEEPDTIKQVIARGQEFITKWANAQIKAGCHVVAVVEGSATKSVIPEDIFTGYVQDALKSAIGQIKAPSVVLGVGGEWEPFLPHLAKTGAAGVVLSTDDDLATCLEKAGGMITMGNVNNLEFMDYSLTDIEDITRKAMATAKGKRFVYSTQYVLPHLVQEEKIKHFIAMARQYGKQ